MRRAFLALGFLIAAASAAIASSQLVPTSDAVNPAPSGAPQIQADIVGAFQYVYNGTTFDRLRGASDGSDGLVTSAGNTRAIAEQWLFNGTTFDRQRSAASTPNLATGAARVANEQGHSSSLNIIAATNAKASAGRIQKVIVNTAGSTATLICDSTVACAAANTVYSIPATAVGIFDLNFPMATGIRVEPGTSAVLSVSFD